MPNPSRDEIAMAVVRAMKAAVEAAVEAAESEGSLDDSESEFGEMMRIADIAADAVLALLASKRAAEPDVRHFGPIGTHPAPQTADGVPFWRVMPAPPVPHPQTAEPDAWMTERARITDTPPNRDDIRRAVESAGGTLTTPTPDQPKEGDDNE